MGIVTTEASQKIKNMSIVCALLVVTIHVGWPKDLGCFTWYIRQLLVDGVARIGVPFFFVVSGYFLAGHFNDADWWKSETKKRVRSLVIPFFVWSVLSFLAMAPLSILADAIAHRPFGTNLQLSDGRWIHALGLDVDTTPGLTPLWYVRCLFFFVLLSPLFEKAVRRFKTGWLVFAFVVQAVFSYIPVDVDNRPFWNGFLCYGISLSGIFYFSVGVYLRLFNVSFVSRKVAVASLGYGIGVLVLKTLLHVRGVEMPRGIEMLVIPALMYGTWSVMPSARWPSWFTQSSFPVFLLHCIFLGYAGIVLKHCPVGAQSSAIISCIVAMVAPIILTAVMNKAMPKVSTFLFAGRA